MLDGERSVCQRLVSTVGVTRWKQRNGKQHLCAGCVLSGTKAEHACGRWLRLSHLTGSRLSQPARHAASVWSRTIMKKQPSVGAAAEADLSNLQRAFIPGLTESTADRWIGATTELFLSLNGEEDGTYSLPRSPAGSSWV